MAYLEIRKNGKVVSRRQVDDAKAAKGCQVRLKDGAQVRLAIGESANAGDYELSMHDGLPPENKTVSALKVSRDTGASPEGRLTDKDVFPVIEGYQVTGRLGEGGMGTVWKAMQLSTRRPVALKFLSERCFGSDKAKARFQREVELSARLEHPNIARVYDSGINRGMYYYALEFIDGLPLDLYLLDKKLPREKVLELMQKVCQAVLYAHQRGVIHRDLKPANILVSQDGQPHVLDFGLAKALLQEEDDDRHVTISIEGEIAGTPAYMSPEQAAGKHEKINTRSDVYTLGVILYRLLTGEYPHEISGTRYELIRRIVEEEVRPPRQFSKDIDKELEAMLLKALAQKPEDRYADAGGMAEDLGAYLSGEALAAHAPSGLYRVRKGLRRHRTAVAMVCLGLALVVAVLGYVHSRLEVQASQKLLAEAKRIADVLPADKGKLTAAQNADAQSALKNVQAALAMKPGDAEALELHKKLQSYVAPAKELTATAPASSPAVPLASVQPPTAPASRPAGSRGLLAHYPLSGNGVDATGNNPAMQLENVSYSENALILNGIYQNGKGEGYRAEAAIRGLNYDSFAVALEFRATEFYNAKREILVCGRLYRWFGLCVNRSGNLQVYFNNGAYSKEFSNARVEAQAWHDIVCSVDIKKRIVETCLDGKQLEGVPLPDGFALEVVATDQKNSERLVTFTNYAYGGVFLGQVANLRVYETALSNEQMQGVHELRTHKAQEDLAAKEAVGGPSASPSNHGAPAPAARMAPVASGPESPALAALRKNGAFQFPQKDANVLCDRPDLRFSVWSNPRYLFAQAVLWNEGNPSSSETQDKREIADWSQLILNVDANGIAILKVDRNYCLNPGPSMSGLRYQVRMGEHGWTGIQSDTRGRGALRFVDVSGGKRVRVDSYLVPLAEISRQAGDRIRIGYCGYSQKPGTINFPCDSQNYDYVLANGGEIDANRVPDGRDDIPLSPGPPPKGPKGGFSFADANGKALDAERIPADLRQAVIQLVNDPKLRTDANPKTCALVVARTLFPVEEKDATFSSTLRGKGWYGGMHYLATGGYVLPARAPLENAVCIRLMDFQEDCILEVAKIGYKTVTLDVPRNMAGKIIWMGDITLVRYQGKAGVVQGTVCLPDGKPLEAPGEVSIRVNGTPATNRVPLTKGSFAFRKMSPGKYLVEFWINNYSVATWSATLPDDGGAESQVIAYKRSSLDIDLHVDGAVRHDSVKCGVAYADADLEISPKEKLRLDQAGNVFEFYTPLHKIVVLHGPFGDMKAVAARVAAEGRGAWFSWRGTITDGDLIVLLDDKQAGSPAVYAVAEIVKLHDPPAMLSPQGPSASPSSQPATGPASNPASVWPPPKEPKASQPAPLRAEDANQTYRDVYGDKEKALKAKDFPAFGQQLLKDAAELDANSTLADLLMAKASEYYFRSLAGDNKVQLRDGIIGRLMSAANDQLEADKPAEALRLLQEASRIAAGDADILKDIANVRKAAHARIDLDKKMADLGTKLQSNPDDAASARELAIHCIVELDRPTEAAEHLAAVTDEPLKTHVPLAAQDPNTLEELVLKELGKWYEDLSKAASPEGKVVTLSRARMYYQRFLAAHTGTDEHALVVRKSLAGVEEELKKLSESGVRGSGRPQEIALNLGKGVSVRLVRIPAGKFLMGGPQRDHEVRISKPFYMGVYTVTQAQYEAVMGTNPSEFKNPNSPVDEVSWIDAVEFCKKLSQMAHKPFGLPTEAQWEYACRAGSNTPFSFGDETDVGKLGDYAWYVKNSDSKTHPVGLKTPNAWGLYDMYGNVWQWCADWYADSYSNANTTDPQGAASGSDRVLRGGSWNDGPLDCRSAARGRGGPGDRGSDSRGFRVIAAGVD